MTFEQFQGTRRMLPVSRADAILAVGDGILRDDTVSIHAYRDPEDEMVYLEELEDGSFYMIYGFGEAVGTFDLVERSLYNAVCD